MKTNKSIFILFILVFALSSVSLGKYSGGTGEPNNPYLIATPNDLNSIGLDANDWDKHFLMTADINMAGYSYTTAVIAPDVCELWGFQGTKFTGIFDGNDFVIEGIVIDHNEIYKGFLGLFGYVEAGKIRNLGLDKCFVKGTYEIGVLIGYNTGEVTNCFSHGQISGDDYCADVGGLIGKNIGPVIDCYSTVEINAGLDCPDIGGLVGDNMGGVINNCYAASKMSAGSGSGPLGGLVGTNSGDIENCFATGSISGFYHLGGLVGRNDGFITDCYSTCDVNGTDNSWLLGGLIGDNDNYGEVYSCYSTGSVKAGDNSNRIGGLIGHRYGGHVSIYCFWDVQTSGQSTSSGGTGLTTSQMLKRSTFADAGWDMVNVWDIGENQTYPFLRKHLPSDINKDNKTDFYDLAILAEHWLEEY